MSRALSRLYPSREEFMKVDGPDHPEPARPPPASGQFQQALQRASATSSPRIPADSNPSRLMGPEKPRPRLPLPTSVGRPPTSAVPSPLSTARPVGTAHAPGSVLATSRSALASPENLGQTRQM